MENTEVWFEIIGKKEFDGEIKTSGIQFIMEYDEDGWECGWQSRNPCSTWTDYDGWHNNWREQDDDLEVILGEIRDASYSDTVSELVACMEEEDIGKTYEDIEIYGIDKDTEIDIKVLGVTKK